MQEMTISTEILQGLEYQKQGNLSQAIHIFQQAIQHGNVKARLYLALLYAQEQGEYQLALQELHALFPQYPKTAYLIAYIHQCRKNYTKAVEFYQQAILANVPLSHLQLGYLYEGLQEYTPAIMQYQIALFKGIQEAGIALGNLFEQMEDQEQANQYFITAASGFSDFVFSRMQQQTHSTPFANALVRWKKDLDFALEKEVFSHGNLYESKGEYAQAFEKYHEGLKHRPEEAKRCIVKLLAKMSNDQERYILLTDAARNGLSLAFYHLALYYLHKGDQSNALLAIRKFLRLTDSKDPEGVTLFHQISQKTS